MLPLQWNPFEPSSWFTYERSHLIVRHGAEEFKKIANRECNKIKSMSKSDLFKYVVNVTAVRENPMYWINWSLGSLGKLERLFYTVGWHEGTIRNGSTRYGNCKKRFKLLSYFGD